MASETITLRLDKERNEKIEAIIDSLKKIYPQIRKIKVYLLAGFYGYYLGERKPSQGEKIDVSRGEFLEKIEYKDFNLYIKAIYELSLKENENKGIEGQQRTMKDMYSLFEEYVNAGVDKLSELLQRANKPEEFLEELELEMQKAYEALGLKYFEQEVQSEYGQEKI